MRAALVYLKDGKGKTDSLTVAKEFGKRHADVMRAVRDALVNLPNDFQERNFALIARHETNAIGGVVDKSYYELTRDGFMFIVFGFTGKKADTAKVVFIEEFNRMEAKLVDVGLQPQELTINDLLRMTADKLQSAVDYAADHAEQHGLTSIAIIKKYPEKSAKLIEETKPKIKNLNKYGPSGILTVGLKNKGITSKVARVTPKGPALLFNTKEVEEFMGGYDV